MDADKIVEKGRVVTLLREPFKVGVHVGVDRIGRYIVPIPRDPDDYKAVAPLMSPLTKLYDGALPEPRDARMITAVSVLYETKARDVSVPAYWFCETEAEGEENVVRYG